MPSGNAIEPQLLPYKVVIPDFISRERGFAEFLVLAIKHVLSLRVIDQRQLGRALNTDALMHSTQLSVLSTTLLLRPKKLVLRLVQQMAIAQLLDFGLTRITGAKTHADCTIFLAGFYGEKRTSTPGALIGVLQNHLV